MKKDTFTVYVSPNRTNIRFSVRKVKKEEHLNELQWLIDIIKLKGKDTPKTILFCNTINEVASVANHLLFKLGIHAYKRNLSHLKTVFLVFTTQTHGKQVKTVSWLH